MSDPQIISKKNLNWAGLALILVLMIAGLGALSGRTVAVVAMMENWLIDLRVAMISEQVDKDARLMSPIALVAVNEDTLSTLAYRHPIDRALLAGLIDKASAAGAKAIAFDVLFDQPTEPEKDAALAASIATSNIPVFIAHASKQDQLTDKQVNYLNAFAPEAQRLLVNLIRDDRDGIVRSTLPKRKEGNKTVYGMANALASLIKGSEVKHTDIAPDRHVIRLRRGPNADEPPFPIYPAHALKFLPEEWLKDRVLLVGAVLPHEDRFPTSFVALDGVKRGNISGVEIHAQAMADHLQATPLKRSDVGLDFAICAVLAFVGIAFGATPGRLMIKVLGTLILCAVYVTMATVLVQSSNLILPIFMPALALFASTGAGAALAGRRHRSEKRFIRDAMSRYVSPAVVQELQAHPEKLRLGGERKELTFMFTDIASFTTTSEATPPEVLVPVLNDYLNQASKIVIAHGGTVDKFIGDALVAIFGAPIQQPDHAARAIACAKEVDAFAETFISEGKAKEIGLGMTRIGVHTGHAVVGNIGGDLRFDYTAIGDTVNTAARLEGANKHFGTRTSISATTRDAAQSEELCPIGDLVLKGRSHALRTFTVLPADQAYLAAFAKLEAGDAGSAKKLLQSIDDPAIKPLAKYHLNRLENGEAGVTIIMKEK
jgi:adenylate cyclase